MRRRLPWVLWFLALMACPVAITVIAQTRDAHGVHPAFDEPMPWQGRAIEYLCTAHLVVSLIAAVAVFWLTKGIYRWLAWAGVLAWWAFTFMWAWGSWMKTTGNWL